MRDTSTVQKNRFSRGPYERFWIPIQFVTVAAIVLAVAAHEAMITASPRLRCDDVIRTSEFASCVAFMEGRFNSPWRWFSGGLLGGALGLEVRAIVHYRRIESSCIPKALASIPFALFAFAIMVVLDPR